jgi:hypothetical protein
VSEEPSSCGQGLASQATMPARMADVLNGVADVLEHHMTALDRGDPAGAQEHDGYGVLVSDHRQVAEALAALADQLAGSHDLPMGRHDEQVLMSDTAVQTLEALVHAEADLLALLQRQVPELQGMLAQMRAAG